MARTLAVLIGIVMVVRVPATAGTGVPTTGVGRYEGAMQPPVDHEAAIGALYQVRRDKPGRSLWCLERLVPLLELACRQKLLEPPRHEQMKADLEEIARMLSGLVKGVENREQ